MKKLLFLLLATTAFGQITPTTNIGLSKITPNTEVGTWGPIVNSNWDIVDSYLGGNTPSPNFSAKIFGNVVYADGFSSSSFDANIKTCVDAVIARGGGICNALALSGAQTQSNPIDVGNVAAVPVTLLLSPYLTDSVLFNTGGACAFKVFDRSNLFGQSAGAPFNTIIQAASGSGGRALICSNPTSASGQYVNVSGFQVYNPLSAAWTYGADATRLFDGSEWSNLVVANYGHVGLHVQSSCCHSVFRNLTVDGNHVAGSIPVQVDSLTGDFQTVNAIQFLGLTANHPGTGLNNIIITNTFTSSNNTPSADFFGTYMEGNSTDTTTPFVKIDSFERTGWFGTVAQSRSTSSTQRVWSLVADSVSGIRPRMSIQGFNFQNTSQTLPAPVVDDVAYPQPIYTDSQGTLASYDNRNVYFAGFTMPEQSAANAEVVARVNTVACYNDISAHLPKCSYNNGAFLPVVQKIVTTLTTTTATTDNVAVTGMVSTGHCQLTPTNSAAAAGIASVFISAKTTNQITVTHTATSGWTFDVECTPQ